MLITKLLSVIAPHECLGCSAEGALLCNDCRHLLRPSEERCYHCHRTSPGFRTCQFCAAESSLYAVFAAVRYTGLAKDLIWRLKFGRAQNAATEVAQILSMHLRANLPPSCIITHVPTATNRVRQRGYDQAALIAKSLARQQHIPYTPLLRRTSNTKQVGSDKAARESQMQRAFRAINHKHINGSTVILIDDVITTGATLQAAAAELHAAGARRVIGIVFAQA